MRFGGSIRLSRGHGDDDERWLGKLFTTRWKEDIKMVTMSACLPASQSAETTQTNNDETCTLKSS